MNARFILAAGLAVVLIVAACGDNGDSTTPEATATPAATVLPSPTVEMIGGVKVRPMSVGPEVELPDGVALLIEMGCTQCDGPVTGIERVYRDASGEMQRETLFSSSNGYPDPYISSLALSGDGQTIALTICSVGYCGGLGPVTEDAATALHVSRDGGTTWDVVDERSGAYIVQAVLADGLVLQQLTTGEFANANYEHYPAGTAIEPPEVSASPLAYGEGELGWRTLEGRLLRPDGSPLFVPGEGYDAAWPGRNGLQPGPAGGYAVMYSPAQPDGTEYYLAVYDSDETLTAVFRTDTFVRSGSWLPAGEPVGTAWFQGDELTDPVPLPQVGGASLPAVFDLEAGLIRPIVDPFLDTLARNTVLAVVPWPP